MVRFLIVALPPHDLPGCGGTGSLQSIRSRRDRGLVLARACHRAPGRTPCDLHAHRNGRQPQLELNPHRTWASCAAATRRTVAEPGSGEHGQPIQSGHSACYGRDESETDKAVRNRRSVSLRGLPRLCGCCPAGVRAWCAWTGHHARRPMRCPVSSSRRILLAEDAPDRAEETSARPGAEMAGDLMG